MRSRLFHWLKYLLVLILLFVAITSVILAVRHPSNDREWNDDQKILSYADIKGRSITIHNIRNFTYRSNSDYTPAYYDKNFDLDKFKKVWYIVEPFEGIPGSAHTFLSFEFEDNQFVSISVEIRKEKGETYNPIKGLFDKYELMYVIADERDVVKLRTNYRDDQVFVYPVKTTKEKGQALFLDMLTRANKLKESPEFYNTIVNTCTTNIVKHVNTVTPKRVPLFNLRVLLPENSDKLAYELGLLDTDLSFEQAREYYFINDRALKYADDPNFSVRIRQEE